MNTNHETDNINIYTGVYKDLHLAFINSYLIHELPGIDKIKSQPIFLTILELNMLIRINSLLIFSSDNLPLLKNHILTRATYIFSQLSGNFTLNYNPRQNNYISNDCSYPDDIDDTFSFFYLLYELNPSLITAQHMSKILISLESLRDTKKLFLFHTWYTNINLEAWQSIDPIALSSLAAFFQNHSILSEELKNHVFDSIINFKEKDLSAIDSVSDKSIDKTKPKKSKQNISTSSEFYHSFPLAVYLTTRLIFDEPNSTLLAEKIFNQIKLSYKSKPLVHVHFLFASLFRIYKLYPNLSVFDALKESHIIEQFYSITNPITEDFEISKPFPLYIETIKNNTYTFGSSYHIDRLIAYESRAGHEYFINNYEANQSENLDQDDTELAENLNQDLYRDSIYKDYMNTVIKDISDDDQIFTDLVQELVESKDFQLCKDLAVTKFTISGNNKTILNLRELLQLHLLGLVTYYIYDKVMDGEYSPEYISILEQLQRIFRRELRRLGRKRVEIYESILSQTDLFYACQSDADDCNISIKDSYYSHYQKSIGSCIVPIILFPEIDTELQRFFKHYLLARQILDDFKDYAYDKELRKITTMKSFENSHGDLNSQSIFKAVDNELQEAKISIENLNSDIKGVLLYYINNLEQKIQSCKFELAVIRELKQIISN